MQIQIRMISPNEVEQGVLDGRLHVGVVPQASALSGLEYQPLYSERSLLTVPSATRCFMSMTTSCKTNASTIRALHYRRFVCHQRFRRIIRRSSAPPVHRTMKAWRS